MKLHEHVFDDLVHALELTKDEVGLRAAAEWFVRQIGFRWFAYLGFADTSLTALSSYPPSRTSRYLGRGYAQIDPILSQAKSARRFICWESRWTRFRGRRARRT